MEIGRVQTLRLNRRSQHGVYLSDGEREVLLPAKEVPERNRLNQDMEVYVHLDSDDRPIATLRRPIAQVGEFAAMQVIHVGHSGAFLDQKLDKDLLLPHAETLSRVKEGDTVVVRVLRDKVSGRLIATTKFRKFLEPAAMMPLNRRVTAMVTEQLPKGWRLIVDGLYEGGLFEPEPRRIGETFTGFARDVQEGRVLVASRPQGRAATADFADELFHRLKKAGGYLPYHDGSSAEAIQERFGVSKSVFKRAVGTLLKSGALRIEAAGIRLA